MTAALDLAARVTGIGASEIASICGLSPYETPLDVYLRKLGLVGEAEEDGSMEWGKRLEPVVARKYTEVTGIELTGDGLETLRHPERRWMLATPDRIAEDRSRLVEIKTGGHFAASEWGRPFTDEVPRRYLVQCAWQMAVTGIDLCDVRSEEQ